jgi:hypothetical protein
MASENRSKTLQVGLVLGAGALLEACYLGMHHLYYLKNHAIAFIELGLAAGMVYLIALYGFGQTRTTRAALILLIFSGIVFRATMWPMEPTLSDDLQRYRWEAKVQAHGWNPYAIAPNDPRLADLHDKYYEVMPGKEIPAIYPPATQLVFRATWRFFPGPTAFKVPFAAADVFVLLILAWMFRKEQDALFRVAIYAWNPLVIVEFGGERAQRCVGAAGNCVRAGAGTEAAGVGNRASDVRDDGETVSRGTAAGMDSESGLAGKTRGLVGCGIGWRDGTAGGGAILECAGNAAHNDDVLRGDLEELQRESVHTDRLGDRRKDENSGADGRAGQLGTGAVAGVEKRGTGARGVSSDWNDTGVWAEWIFVVLHVDRAATVFFSESGVADDDGAAVSVLQRADWLRDSGGVQV